MPDVTGVAAAVSGPTVCALAATLALRCRARLGRTSAGRRRTRGERLRLVFWSVAACALMLLALDYVLPIIATFSRVLRSLSDLGDWYAGRRPLQVALLVVMLLIGVIAAFRHRRLWRRAHRGDRIALAAAALLSGLIVLRLVSLHHTDAIVYADFHGFRVLDAAHLAAGVSVTLAALFTRPRPAYNRGGAINA